MVKASAGGGGMGMSVAADEDALRTEFEKVQGFAGRMFGDAVGPARALLPAGAPRRGADPRARRRPGRRPGGAGLLGAAPQPEARRGVAVARRRTRAADGHGGRGGQGRRGRRLPQRRHGRVPAGHRDRRVRLPRDEHPAAGRAPRHRDGLRHRPRRAAAADRGQLARHASTRTPWRRRVTRSSCGSTPRTRSASCPDPARSASGRSRPAPGSASTPATPPARPSRRTTTR